MILSLNKSLFYFLNTQFFNSTNSFSVIAFSFFNFKIRPIYANISQDKITFLLIVVHLYLVHPSQLITKKRLLQFQ